MPAPVGITGGSDGDWQNFSVQHDGWLKVNKRTRFLSYGADGTRFWIDVDGGGTFGTAAPEYQAGNWGANGGQRFGPFSGWVDPGTYRVRIQHELDTNGGNRWGFMGQNNLQLNPGRGINLGGSGYVTAPAGTSISGAFTVEAWVRPATTGTLTILSTRNDFGFDMKLQGGNLVHGDIGTASSWLTTTADAPYNYRVGEWYHIAYCVGDGSYDVYVNGWKAGTGTYSGTPLLDGQNGQSLGGAIFNEGTLSVNQSTLDANTSSAARWITDLIHSAPLKSHQGRWTDSDLVHEATAEKSGVAELYSVHERRLSAPIRITHFWLTPQSI